MYETFMELTFDKKKIIAKLFIFTLDRKEHSEEKDVSYLKSIFDRHLKALIVAKKEAFSIFFINRGLLDNC